MLNNNDTIAAIATGSSAGGIGIIRVSGDDAVAICDKVFRAASGEKLADSKNYTAHYGHIVWMGSVIDEVIALIMRGPHSYTGQDTVEIDCHGGTLVMRRVLNIIIKAGARPAGPGEFSKRAFLSGRVDLSQAESVMGVINAKNDFALKSSMNQLSGAISDIIKKLRDSILHESAYIEAALDDPEHYELDNYSGHLLSVVDNVSSQIKGLLATADRGKILSEGISTVIVGKPNAGKSSIMNTLMGSDIAIVTDIAGTTRDVLTESLDVGGVMLNLIDTAGIRNTEDTVEKIGVGRAKAAVKDADLVLYVVDSSVPLDESDDEIIDVIKDKNVIVLLNKSDLGSLFTESDILLKLGLSCHVIETSAKSNIGMDKLCDTITEMFLQGDVSYNDEVFITSERHKYHLQNAFNSLELVKKSILDGMPEDFFTVDLMDAYTSLGLITGDEIEEDLVEKIFSEFCMGK